MALRFKSKKMRSLALLISGGLLLLLIGLWSLTGVVWTRADSMLLDLFYKRAVSEGKGPPKSDLVALVTITNASYDSFHKNYLDRGHLARMSDTLAKLGPEAVGFDIIFHRPSIEKDDIAFADSIKNLGLAYLPMAFELTPEQKSFEWQNSVSHERLREEYLFHPVEKGPGQPLYAIRAFTQMDAFEEYAMGSGHINVEVDPDGVYRHMLMLVRVEDGYAPTLSLSMYLDYMRIPPDKIVVEWGERIVIPAVEESFLEKDVVVPIDARGRAFVPLAATWEGSFTKVESHEVLLGYEDENKRGALYSALEGRLVLVGDVSTGISDIGNTSLDTDAPLITLHVSMLNALLTNTFYKRWDSGHVILVLIASGLILGLASLMRSSWVLYTSGLLILGGLITLTWSEIQGFRFFPVASAGGSVLVLGFGLTAGLEWAGKKERSFIRNAFAKYVPEKVVHQLLRNPELLRLGGEERVITALFSDLAGFTTISEKMSPSELVNLLNEYLTEMTGIVLDEGGIVDKYEGDAIMAEFGAPIHLPDHADRAVRAGIRMQRRLKELRRHWLEKGLPEMRCRVGINTGPMVVGNMGSGQVFDYTVIGDAVNLASRLEGANKRYNTYLMISENTLVQLTPGLFRTRLLDVIRVQGKTEPVRVYEVIGEAGESLAPDLEAYITTYEKAFGAYLVKDFEQAKSGFESALTLRPEDPACRDMLERIRAQDPNNLPEDWDGSIALNTK